MIDCSEVAEKLHAGVLPKFLLNDYEGPKRNLRATLDRGYWIGTSKIWRPHYHARAHPLTQQALPAAAAYPATIRFSQRRRPRRGRPRRRGRGRASCHAGSSLAEVNTQ